MDINNSYNINFEDIKKSFKFKKNGGLTNSQGKRFKLLPYVANETNLVSNFNGVLGAFSRGVSNKEIVETFDEDMFLEKIINEVQDFENDNLIEKFKDIIRNIFLHDGKLCNFNISTLNYISSTKKEEDIANFIISVIYNEDLDNEIDKLYSIKIDNVLHRLVLQSLPCINEKARKKEDYKCYLPFVKELFKNDFGFLIHNEEMYKKYIKRLIEFYYMFYVSQLSLKLSQFEKADITTPDPVYYTLDWEKTSKNRKAYSMGWAKLERKVDNLFSHAITLELLNHHNNGKEQLSYKELFELFNKLDENTIANEINKLIDIYKKQLGDSSSDTSTNKDNCTGNIGFDKVYILFYIVRQQFIKSSRTRANECYRNWFVKFVKENFAKNRGRLGCNLNITEDDIIFLTNICIKNEPKLKINLLFIEFEKRGVFFDNDSKQKIIQLYEKLNILEKKSDSGDAQYVKSIL